jgi:hypothetical protein
MRNLKLKRASKKKFRLGFGCLMVAVIALVAIAIGGNMMLANKQSIHYTDQQPKEHALMAPPIRRRKPKRQAILKQQNATARAVTVDSQQLLDVKSETKDSIPQQAEQETRAAKPDPVNQSGDGDADKHSAIHVVFSTSCHVKQDWQSYLFFFSAMTSKQQGTVTRLVSGCSPDAQEKVTKDFQEKIAAMSDRFRIHFTPEYGRVAGQNFQVTKYWNKPFGLRHWLENVFGYNHTAGKVSSPLDDDLIVLVDPDMLIQRPFVNHFPQYMPNLWIDTVRNGKGPIRDKVSHGKPMAQNYGFGASWLTHTRSNLTYVVGPDSPVHNVTEDEGRYLYSAGPPYIATARDMYGISYYWTKFLPKIFDLHPQFMSEMYGYCMAAAHLKLEHQLAQGFMVSDANILNGEGWGFMEKVGETVCDVEQFQDRVPQVIHFCQRYSIGEYFMSKYKLPVEILSCDFPLLELPPLDIAAHTNYSHYGDGSIKAWPSKLDWRPYHHAYMVCALMPAINKAATFFKDHHCPNGANYNQTWNTFTVDQQELTKMLNAVRIG